MYEDDEKMDQFILQNAGEDGLSPEAAARVLAGDYGETEESEGGESPDSAEQSEEKAEENKETEGEESSAAEEEPEEQEQVILAKDGRNTIPFSELENARAKAQVAEDKLSAMELKLSEQSELLAKLQEAQEKDADAGNTKATEELFENLEIEFPGAGKLLQSLQEKLDLLEKAEADKALAEQQRTAEEQARKDFDDEVEKHAQNYRAIIATDTFWDWFDKQPSYIQAAKSSGNPAVIADVIKLYESSAEGGDTPEKQQKTPAKEASAEKETVAKKTEQALKDAEEKPAIRSLSDLPGGGDPVTDEMTAMDAMEGPQLMNKMTEWSPEKIEQYLNRTV